MKFKGLTGRVIGFALGLGVPLLGLAGPSAAVIATDTWLGGTSNWATGANWSAGGQPGTGTVVSFLANGANTSPSFMQGLSGSFQFSAGAPAYTFSTGDDFTFDGAGIVNNSSNAPTFNLAAGHGIVFNFNNSASAGNAVLNNTFGTTMNFNGTSTAGSAVITLNNGSLTNFNNNSTGGTASVNILDGASVLDFSGSIGLLSDHKLSIGSFAGQGTIDLGGNQLSVGGNNQSTSFSGIIDDCDPGGDCSAHPLAPAVPDTGGSLLKIGTGTLTLTGVNTYTGGTEIDGGVINISNDNNLGAATGGLILNGGTLQLNAGILFDPTRPFAMGANGGTFDTNGHNAVIGSNITGAGSLTKTGAGELDLAGINNYSGGTIVNAGILELISGAALNSAGALTINGGAFDLNGNTQTIGDLSGAGGTLALDGGTLTVNSANSTSFAGAITGGANTGFIKTGSGKLLLTGASTLTGPTSINGGILSVNGSLSGSAITVNSGGTLGGSGTVGPTLVKSGGTLSPGNSIGTLHVAGNLNLAPGSTYFAEISPSSSDETIATGTASLMGSVTASFQSGTFTSARYTLINSAGALSGTFSGLTTLNLPLGFSASLTYDANDAFLVLKANADPNDGLIHASLRTALIADERLIRDAVLAHLSEDDTGVSVWGEGFTAYGEINDPGEGLHHAHSGGVAGVDLGLGDGLRAGLAGAYTADKLSLAAKQSAASGTAGHVVAYADWTDAAWRISAGAELGWGSNQIARQSTTVSETDSDHQANRTAQIFGEAGYGLTAMGGLFVPHADIVWVQAASGAFAETGPLAGLSGPGVSDSLTYSVLGLRALLHPIMLGDIGLSPRFDMGWQHALSGLTPAQAVTVTSSGASAVLLGVAPSTDAATMRIGMDIGLLPNAALFLGYDGLISQREIDHAVTARFTWNF